MLKSPCPEESATVEMRALVTWDSNAERGDGNDDDDEPIPEAVKRIVDNHDRPLWHGLKWLLFTSHFAAQFSEVSWQFFVALFLAACTNYKSLILVSTYGLSLNLAVALTGARLGWLLDHSNRLSSARWLITTENAAVVLGTICCFMLLSEGPSVSDDGNDATKNWLEARLAHVPDSRKAICSLVGIHACGAVAQVLDQTFLVAIERDWIVVISRTLSRGFTNEEGGFQRNLSQLNVAMKQIDLTCKIAAPGISGLVLSQLASENGSGEATMSDLQKACLFIGIANAIALVVEYICTARIYSIVPDLAHKKKPQSSSGMGNDCATDLPILSDEPTYATTGSRCLPPGFGIYMMQPICWGGLGLSLLYANALTFGNGIMTAYLLHRGQKIELVGALRGIASAIGLLGTFAYQLSAKCLSLETTGMWSITYQCCFMGLAVMSVFIEQDTVAIALLVTGVCLSRIGLWVFDIAITQMQQQEIPEGVRGAIGGVQQSLNAFFTLLSFALGLVFPDPKDFVFFVVAAFVSVACALALFAVGVFVPRMGRK